jgi:energy-coupling factor transporter transmembrane protein EcfT
MTHKDIKLLALAVIWGSSLFAFAISEDGGKDLLMLLVVVVIGIWFLLYWFYTANATCDCGHSRGSSESE